MSDVTKPLADFLDALARVREVTEVEYVKLGTEDEGLDRFEVSYIDEVLPDGVEISVKIGGPCAYADLRLARDLNALSVTAPMVESTYALHRFVGAVDEVFGDAAADLKTGFNLETITAYERIDDLLGHPAAKKLKLVTVGRSDLSASMGTVVVDERVRDVTCDIARKVRAAGLPIHVGGKLTLASLEPVLSRVPLDGVHTRFVAFPAPALDAIESTIRLVLECEITLLRLLATRSEARAEEHLKRAEETAARFA